MGDDDGGAPLLQLRHRRLHFALGLHVQRRGRFVEDQDRRIGQERARHRHALTLAARELHAALADFGVVALRQLGDEVVRPRPLGRAAMISSIVASGRA